MEEALNMNQMMIMVKEKVESKLGWLGIWKQLTKKNYYSHII